MRQRKIRKMSAGFLSALMDSGMTSLIRCMPLSVFKDYFIWRIKS